MKLKERAKIKRKELPSGYSRKSIIIALVGAAFALISIVACLIAKGNSAAVTKYHTPIARKFCGLWGRIMSVFPFSVGEIMLYLMIVAFIASVFLLIFRWVKKYGRRVVGRYFAVLALVAGCHVMFFVFTYGLSYFGKPLSKQLSLEVGKYSAQELEDTARYYLGLVNEFSQQVPRREDDGAVDTNDSSTVFAAAQKLFATQTVFDWDDAYISKPKKVFSWYLLSCFDIAGIYDPFTSECLVNTDCSPVSLPFSACHELSHRLGYAPENEANFVAILLCRESDNAIMSYSGCYMGFIYCYNALVSVDRQAAYELWQELSEGVLADVRAANEHAAKYEDKVTVKVSDAVNDTYLKIMDQSGVRSYGEVVDMLIAEYLTSKP